MIRLIERMRRRNRSALGRRGARAGAALALAAILPSCIFSDDATELAAVAPAAAAPKATAVVAASLVPEDFYEESLGCAVYGPPRWSAPEKAGPVDEAWPISSKDGYGWRVRDPEVVWREGRLELEVFYPKDSLHPGVPRYPLGGISFADFFDVGRGQAGCLSYEVRFQPGFKFAKGGKLPGLWGGRGAAGCVKETANGFSTRFMWDGQGRGFVYGYLADRTSHCGVKITPKNGALQFIPGQWHRLDQEIRLNTPGKRDGVLRVWFDRKLMIERRDVMFRADKKIKIDGLFFSSFFGGSSPGNISPQDQSARFRDFEYREISE